MATCPTSSHWGSSAATGLGRCCKRKGSSLDSPRQAVGDPPGLRYLGCLCFFCTIAEDELNLIHGVPLPSEIQDGQLLPGQPCVPQDPSC